MFGEFDRLTLGLLLCLAVVLVQVIRKIRRGRTKDSDELWDALSPRQRLRGLLQSTPVGYQEVDLDGIIRSVNDRECDLRGLEPTRLAGMTCWELVPAEEQDQERQAFFRRIESETPQPVARKKYRHPNGETLLLEVHENLLRDEGGRVVGMAFKSLDITDRQRSEEAIYQTTSELSALFEALPDLFLRVGEGGVIRDSKAGKSAGARWPSLLAAGQRLSDAIPPDAARGIAEAMKRVRESRSAVVVEYEAGGHGESQFYEARVLPLEWNDALVILRDITASKLNEIRVSQNAGEVAQKNRELEIALLKAQEATKLKSRFLANMSHEIRTPMNGVIGMTEFLLSTPLNSEQREYAGSVKSSANSLLTILNDILDISKIEAGKLQIETIPFDLGGTVREVATVFELRARGKNLDFTCEAPPKLECQLAGDPGRLKQILNNLLGNALKFTHEGKIALRIELIRDSGEKVTLRFAVKDTGIGISLAQRQNLFQTFMQGDDSMNRKYGGTGLGLAISKQIVELMRGQIGVESEVGVGSTFWFTAPFGKQPLLASGNAGSKVELEGLRVLVADSSNSARAIVSRYLPSWGCVGTAVSRGEEIVPRLKAAVAGSDPFRVALIDLELAQLERRRVEQEIREDPAIAGVLLISMTSSPMRGDGIRVHRAGYSGYLLKPVQPEELRGVIEEVLRAGAEWRRAAHYPPYDQRTAISPAREGNRRRLEPRTGMGAAFGARSWARG